jgi:hypothetical protein
VLKSHFCLSIFLNFHFFLFLVMFHQSQTSEILTTKSRQISFWHKAENEPTWLQIINLQCWFFFCNQIYLFPCFFYHPLFFNRNYLFPTISVSHHVSSISEPWNFSNQISSNVMESYGTHEVLAIKRHQIHWNLMGPIWILAIKSLHILSYTFFLVQGPFI